MTTFGAVTNTPFGVHTDNNVGLTTEAKGSVDTSPVLGEVNAVLFTDNGKMTFTCTIGYSCCYECGFH